MMVGRSFASGRSYATDLIYRVKPSFQSLVRVCTARDAKKQIESTQTGPCLQADTLAAVPVCRQ
jgi:hypothetical protein